MKNLLDLIDKLDEELNSAEYYTEQFLDKVMSNDDGGIYKKLAEDEMSHAAIIKNLLDDKVAEYEKLIKLNSDTTAILKYSNRRYQERMKQMNDNLSVYQ